MLLLRSLSDFSKLPDTYFKLFHGILLKNIDNNLITSQSINNFLCEYLTKSRILHLKYFKRKLEHAEATLECAKQEVENLHNAPTTNEGDNIDTTALEKRDRDSHRWTMHKVICTKIKSSYDIDEPAEAHIDKPHLNDDTLDEPHLHDT
ncbi:hypothetical protein V8D89_016252 [Ganoderma adspersum]